MNTHVIRGEEKTTGKRFFIAIHPSPVRHKTVYTAVPHRSFATAMPRAEALSHCHELSQRYPGNTYAPSIVNSSVKPHTAKGGRA